MDSCGERGSKTTLLHILSTCPRVHTWPLCDKEDEDKGICAVTMHTRDRNDCFGSNDYSVVDQQGGKYDINPCDKQHQRQNETK